ncbi:MAG: hypothetical protein HC906_19220 [Bacteroidales bacterium]|nr:hypothetical protein [Bacteroidales bacterium]
MMGCLGNKQAFHLMDPVDKETIYLTRLRPVKLINPDNGFKLDERSLKVMNDHLNILLKEHQVEIGIPNFKVNLYDFIVFVETIFMYWRNIDSGYSKDAEKIKQMFPLFYDQFKKFRIEAYMQIDRLTSMIGWLYSDMLHQLFWIENERFSDRNNPKTIYFNNYFIHSVKPECVSLEIDGHKRIVYRLGCGITGEGICWLNIVPEQLGFHGILSKVPIQIYIQAHTLERMKERLGYLFDFYYLMNMVPSFLDPEFYKADDGNLLIAYKMNSKKYGYFKADIIGDKLLLRTFLFLTNDGTPEGKKLARLLGIQKEDKKYLGIDKYEFFIKSDFENNEKLKAVFHEAGCGHLFELKEQLKNNTTFQLKNTDYISRYLGLDEKKKEKELEN